MTYRYRIATVFLLGFFIDCVNIFMPVVALPAIAAHFAVSPSAGAWVAYAYILGLTVIIPLGPWLAARWGARALLTGSMLVFALAALACGLADSLALLLACRFIQGLAGGLIIPVGQALTFNLFQGAQRSRISTLVMAVALIAPAGAPTLGGLIVDHASWRWIFLANMPAALVAAGLACCWLQGAARSAASAAPRPDIAGLLMVGAALAASLVGISLYGADAAGAGPVVLACLLCGLLLGAWYVRHARKLSRAHDHAGAGPLPIVDLRLLRSGRLVVSMLAYHGVPGVFAGANLLNIFYLQQVLGMTAQQTGMLMMVYAGGALLAMLAAGSLYNRLGAARLFLAGMLLHSAGVAALAIIASRADLAWLLLAYLLMGVGGGMVANTAQTTALLDFEGSATHQASVIWNINRQMALSVGAALFLMLYKLLAGHFPTARAYHLTFIAAASLGLAPLLTLTSLNKEKPWTPSPAASTASTTATS